MPGKILSLLKGGGRKAVTGPEISGALGISRAAVWKKIEALRRKGYKIEGGRGGYRLLAAPELSAEELELLLPGKKVVFLDSVTSTSETINKLAVSGAKKCAGGLVVIADRQEAGKGRLGREWASPPGVNIYMSYLFHPGIPPRLAPMLPLAAALGAALALKARTGLEVKLKWPNDLVAHGRKLGGVLMEVRSDPDRIVQAIAGIGLNVNAGRADFPKKLKQTATSVFLETGRRADRAALAAAVIKEFDYWRAEDPGKLLFAYRGLSDTIGRKVSLESEGCTYRGTAVGVEDDGRLAVKTEGGRILRFSSGDAHSIR